eukprot:1116897-Prorocentrum_minimum.AAC.2
MSTGLLYPLGPSPWRSMVPARNPAWDHDTRHPPVAIRRSPSHRWRIGGTQMAHRWRSEHAVCECVVAPPETLHHGPQRSRV